MEDVQVGEEGVAGMRRGGGTGGGGGGAGRAVRGRGWIVEGWGRSKGRGVYGRRCCKRAQKGYRSCDPRSGRRSIPLSCFAHIEEGMRRGGEGSNTSAGGEGGGERGREGERSCRGLR